MLNFYIYDADTKYGKYTSEMRLKDSDFKNSLFYL